MGDIGGAAQAAASVADTTMNDATQIYEAEQNRKFDAEQAGAQRDWSAQQASLNRTFQAGQQVQAENYNTQMSDTAMQRRVADLKAAGLNPLLAVGSLGGASAPVMSGMPGSTAPGGAAASMNSIPSTSPITQGLQGVLNAQKQRDLMDKQTTGVGLDNSKKQAELPYAGAQASAALDQTNAQISQLFAQADALKSQYDVNEANYQYKLNETDYAAKMWPLMIKAKELENQATQYGMPELATQSKFWSSGMAYPFYAGQQANKFGGDLAGTAVATALGYLDGINKPGQGSFARGISQFAPPAPDAQKLPEEYKGLAYGFGN